MKKNGIRISIKRKSQKKQREKNFIRIFLSVSVSILLVIFVGTVVVYQMVKEMIIDQNTSLSMQAFSQIQTEFENANHNANIIATQISLDNICASYLTVPKGGDYDIKELGKVRRQLSLYQLVNPNVESVYLYSEGLDMVLTSGKQYGVAKKAEFFDKSLVELLESPDQYNIHNLIRRERVTSYANGMERAEVLYTYLLFPEDRKGPGNAVAVNFKFDDMLLKILDMDVMRDSRMLIIDEKGERIVDLGTGQVKESDKLQNTVLELAKQKEGYREFWEDGQRYFISYLYSEGSGWNYVKITHWDAMFRALEQWQRNMQIVMGAILLAMTGVILWNAVSITRVYRRMNTEHRDRDYRREAIRLREGFLSDFLHGRRLFRKNQLQMNLEPFGFQLDKKEHFTLLILQIESYEQFRKRFGKGSYDIKYGFLNVFEEIFGTSYRSAGLINRDNTFTIMLELGEEEDWQARIGILFEEFCEKVKIFVDWNFMLAGTNQRVSLEQLPEMNEQLKGILEESFFYPENTYYTLEQVEREHRKQVAFWCLETERILEAVGQGQDAKGLFLKFSEALEKGRMSDYRNAMDWLAIMIARSNRGILEFENDTQAFLLCLEQCEKVTEVEELFLQNFERIRERVEQLSVKKGVAGKLDGVKQYIEENCSDLNMNLEHLGDEFSVSPNYLGRMFKKDTGMSVADYINQERLKLVLRDLQETEDTAKDIAEKYGFASTNYFYTYFRKKVGVTPQVYRQRLREAEKRNS